MVRPSRLAPLLLLGLSFALGCADTTSRSAASAPTALHRLTIGAQALDVEVAATDAARQRGLMFREALPAGRGMLFVFRTNRSLSFWMRDTLVPLDLAFADEEGRIFQIERMAPQSDEPRSSRRPARYALEAPAGWFAEHGLQPGARMTIPDSIRHLPVE
jgi:uncharacterized membrane protein (UPF0127 family)